MPDPPVAVPGPASAKERRCRNTEPHDAHVIANGRRIGARCPGVAAYESPCPASVSPAAPTMQSAQEAVLAMPDEDPRWHGPADPVVSPADTPTCDYCGSLVWTVEKYGRVVHKQHCPHRTDPLRHQGNPGLWATPEPVSPADTIRLTGPKTHICWTPDSVPKEKRELVSLVRERDLAALLAVGERDKAEREQLERDLAGMVDLNAEYVVQRERDRQQIARLTEALRTAVDVAIWMSGASAFGPDGEAGEAWPAARERLYEAVVALDPVDAVPAGEEDARP